MKVLWIVNMTFPEATAKLQGDSVLKNTGGWLLACANELVTRDNVRLSVVSVLKDVHELKFIKGERMDFYIIPLGQCNNKYNRGYEKFWKLIIEETKPDIVNIQGSEFPHSLSFLRLYPNIPTVLTIQGLSSEIAKFYNYGLTKLDILKNITLRDVCRGTLFTDKRRFESKGKCEVEIFSRVKYVIGRTTWDKSHALALNPNLSYFHCNESLRLSFYSDEWNYTDCIPCRIFMSQAGYPFKGLQQLIRALPAVIRIYPKTKIRIAGHNILRNSNLKSQLKLSGYGLYIKKLLKKFNLSDKIEFIGFLDETELKRELLLSNLYICPSAIENSPNSLCEAQMLGVPVIASYAGGIPDFISNINQGLMFRYEDIAVLSQSIIETFKTSASFDNTEMRQIAHKRHNLRVNVDTLVGIYNQIIS